MKNKGLHLKLKPAGPQPPASWIPSLIGIARSGALFVPSWKFDCAARLAACTLMSKYGRYFSYMRF